MTNLPQVPKLPYISGKTLFEDDEKAKEWFEILQKRKAVLCKLVRNTTAHILMNVHFVCALCLMISPSLIRYWILCLMHSARVLSEI